MRLAGLVRGLTLAITLALAALPYAAAETVSFMSASPYQLADLLQQPEPVYDLAIEAELEYPEHRAERMPGFVFMHGSGGPLRLHRRYLELARSLGFVTLQLDSFGPRGVASTVGDQTNATAAMMTIDLLRALRFLAARPEIDPARIVVMGSSLGAVAAQYVAWTPIREKVAGAHDYAGYILLYPMCAIIEDGRVSARPVHVYIGALDNWTPAAPCIAEVERMRGLGRHWAITVYDNNYHAFDGVIGTVRTRPDAYSFADCRVALRADGYEYETGSGLLLTRAERGRAIASCARKGGVKLGGWSTNADRLRQDIAAFLRAALP